MTDKLEIPAEVTPCFSSDPGERRALQALYASTDVLDHREAAEGCRSCYFRPQCFSLALAVSRECRWTGAPEGTWGGVLFKSGRPIQLRAKAGAA